MENKIKMMQKDQQIEIMKKDMEIMKKDMEILKKEKEFENEIMKLKKLISVLEILKKEQEVEDNEAEGTDFGFGDEDHRNEWLLLLLGCLGK